MTACLHACRCVACRWRTATVSQCRRATRANPAAMASLLHFATAYAARTPVPLDLAVPDRVPASSEELKRLEETYQVQAQSSRIDTLVCPQATIGQSSVFVAPDVVVVILPTFA